MAEQMLQMKYHPAKKEVEFKRFQAGKEKPIRDDSRLFKYMNKKGQFVLQDYGNTFFDDIAQSFDGIREINISVITTKLDFEDFLQMIEYYNQEGKCRIRATLLAELPDMNATYDAVKNYGERAIEILKEHKSGFFQVAHQSESVSKAVKVFSDIVDKEIKGIQEKIGCMDSNRVTLCFAGVYSAGKSALINAILGYRILPESMESKTAKRFRIESPKADEQVRITFSMENTCTELVWSGQADMPEFLDGPTESETRVSIQKVINENKGEPRHCQIYKVLEALNDKDSVSSEIRVFFPISLDTPKVQFAIYDTPGTDSNYAEHKKALQDALSQQTHSILIFVLAPDKLEGSGNSALLSYLRAAEEKESKASIDIGRSLFVINKADGTEPDAREALQKAEIKCTDNQQDEEAKQGYSIKLADKKLFFVSAWMGYAAKAKQNKVATEKEIGRLEDNGAKVVNLRGRYYKADHCATSECATRALIQRSDEALRIAAEAGDEMETVHICSGLYALENEISLYGEKYAAAVKAFAIIDGVGKTLAQMTGSAKLLQGNADKTLQEIETEIAEIKSTIENAINTAYDKYQLPDENLPIELLKKLHLDKESLYIRIHMKARTDIDKLIKEGLWGLIRAKYKESDKEKINQKIAGALNDYANGYVQTRKKCLETTRNQFLAEVKKVISEQGDLSDDAKAFVCNIQPSEIAIIEALKIDGIYDENKETKKRFGMPVEYIDKESFLKDVTHELNSITGKIYRAFVTDYKKNLTNVLEEIEDEFTTNLEKYSTLLKAKTEDRAAIKTLEAKIHAAAEELKESQDNLNQIVWRGKEDV